LSYISCRCEGKAIKRLHDGKPLPSHHAHPSSRQRSVAEAVPQRVEAMVHNAELRTDPAEIFISRLFFSLWGSNLLDRRFDLIWGSSLLDRRFDLISC